MSSHVFYEPQCIITRFSWPVLKRFTAQVATFFLKVLRLALKRGTWKCSLLTTVRTSVRLLKTRKSSLEVTPTTSARF